MGSARGWLRTRTQVCVADLRAGLREHCRGAEERDKERKEGSQSECGSKPVLTVGSWRDFPCTALLLHGRAMWTSGARKGEEVQVLAGGSQAETHSRGKDKGIQANPGQCLPQ